MKVTNQFATFDATTFMLLGLARTLQGGDISDIFPVARPVMRSALLPILTASLRLPPRARSELVRRAGGLEGLRPEQMGAVDAEQIASYLVGHYPERAYPAMAIGSANGALTHLCAALGIPYLSQTFLVLVRRDIPVDDLRADLAFGREAAPRLLGSNPRVALYQMHDPSNDRLMSHDMAYFRVKYIDLPDAYRAFIRRNLQPGGTLIVSENTLPWPVSEVSDRHTYQVGGYGGTTLDEYLHGGERVERLLARYDSPREKFIVPEPTATGPEAEWGFEPRLLGSVEAFAAEHGYRVKRLIFEDPEDLSVLGADAYRWWYEQRGYPTKQLFAESYTNMLPAWAPRTGTVPLWLVFNGENSLNTAREYVGSRDFSRVYLTVFSNNVEAIGIPPIDDWVEALSAPGRAVRLVGVHEEAFPVDYTSPFQFYFDFKDRVPLRLPAPEPLTLEELECYLAQSPPGAVQWM